MATNIKRISTLQIAENVSPLNEFYGSLGFARIETDTDECTGWLSPDGTGVIISAASMMARDFGADVANDLAGKSIPYIYVHSIDAAQDCMKDAKVLRRQTAAPSSVREILVQAMDKTFIMAELA